MKKTFAPVLFIMISFFIIGNVQAQSIDLGFGGGLSVVQSPAYYTDVAGFSSEYHIGIKGKLNLPLIPFTPIGFIEYHFFRGSQNTPLINGDTKQNILSLGVGGEWSMSPGPLNPYLGLDLEFNHLSDLETAGSSTAAGVSRMGLGFGIGVMFKLIPLFNLDVSVKYQMLNLIGKKSGEETIGIINLNGALFF